MGFLKKLIFGGRKNILRDTEKLLNADLNTVWSLAATDKNSFLIAMDGWLCRKCSDGENMAALTSAERVFFINTRLEEEVNNGGFSQFFYNAGGNFSAEAYDSLIAIGAESTAKIYKKALSALGGKLPAERESRINMLDEIISGRLESTLEKCDDKFYEYQDDLQELNYRFIMQNKAQFGR